MAPRPVLVYDMTKPEIESAVPDMHTLALPVAIRIDSSLFQRLEGTSDDDLAQWGTAT